MSVWMWVEKSLSGFVEPQMVGFYRIGLVGLGYEKMRIYHEKSMMMMAGAMA